MYSESWCQLLAKISSRMCRTEILGDENYIYREAIYQISGQSEQWPLTMIFGHFQVQIQGTSSKATKVHSMPNRLLANVEKILLSTKKISPLFLSYR